MSNNKSQNSKNSLPLWAKQIIQFNLNSLELLKALDRIVISNEQNIPVSYSDFDGNTTNYNVPSMGYTNSKIDLLEREVKALSGVESSGAYIKIDDKIYKKVIVADINQQPASLNTLNSISNFYSKPNWFFDSLVDPNMLIELDLTDKINKNVKKIFSKRYILEFEKDSNGVLTTVGSEAQIDFNQRLKGRNDIDIAELNEWLTIDGLSNVIMDEQYFDLEPSKLQYKGLFNVLQVVEDLPNRKMWYVLDTLDYLDVETGLFKQIKIGDDFTINSSQSQTIYRLLEINTESNQIRVRFQRLLGNDPIPIGNSVLSIYSDVLSNQKVRISVGYNEYNVLFCKAINVDSNLLSDDYSSGVAYFTNELRYVDENSEGIGGISLQEFYIRKVYDYGQILQELVEKKIPSALGKIPNAPQLDSQNFAVKQINQYLTNSVDNKRIRELHAQKTSLKSEIDQLNITIQNKTKEISTKTYPSLSDKQKAESELKKLTEDVASKNKLLASVVSDIINNQRAQQKITPEYALRGFFEFPEPVETTESRNQEIIQFVYRYKKSSIEGQENPTEAYKVVGQSGSTNAYFPNLKVEYSPVRKGSFNKTTGFLELESENLADADTVNINQISIPILPFERVTLQVKSRSEVGLPDAPLESDLSEEITIDFPTELNSVNTEDATIVNQAVQEDMRIRFESELEAKGLLRHVNEVFIDNSRYFAHTASSIATNFKDDNSKLLSVQEAFDNLRLQVTNLQNTLKRIKGEMQVKVIRNGKEYEIKNGKIIAFNYILLNYAERDTTSQNNAQYFNKIYTINENESVKLRITNIATDNPLGLLSYKSEDVALNITDTANAIRPVLVDENNVLVAQQSKQWVLLKNKRLGSNVEHYRNLVSTTPDTFTPDDMVDYSIGYKTPLNTNQDADDNLVSIRYSGNPPSTPNSRRFVSTVLPVRKATNDIFGTEDAKIISSNESIEIPITIKFCLDSSNPSNNSSINLNQPYYTNHTQVKSLTFKIEPENSANAFEFQIDFRLNFQRPSSTGISGLNLKTFSTGVPINLL